MSSCRRLAEPSERKDCDDTSVVFTVRTDRLEEEISNFYCDISSLALDILIETKVGYHSIYKLYILKINNYAPVSGSQSLSI